MFDHGIVTEDELVREMEANHIRRDSLDLIDRYRGGWRRPADQPASQPSQSLFSSPNTASTALLTGL
jgi:hypothetical protein